MPIYAVEYSVTEKEYRIQTWDAMIEENHNAVMAGKAINYILLDISLSYKEAVKKIARHNELLSKRQEIKPLVYVQMPTL